jgi:hypothetical protein
VTLPHLCKGIAVFHRSIVLKLGEGSMKQRALF